MSYSFHKTHTLKTKKLHTISPSKVIFLIMTLLWIDTPIHAQQDNSSFHQPTFSLDKNKIRIYIPDTKDTLKLLIASDTHLWMSDDREDNYRKYSNRMAAAYHVTKHFKTGEDTNPEKAFIETVNKAENLNIDAIALLGDIFSYPSEAAIDWTTEILDKSGIPYYYTCGNHDWHYEGMEGSEVDLRQEWINKRLLKMYKGNNPLNYSVDIKGIRLLFIDNSTYEILPKQLAFLQQQIKSGKPTIVMMHIPLYAQGRSVGFGCAHPDWNTTTDPSYVLEKRNPWPQNGHNPTTMKFREEVINAQNILAVFAGHIHEQSLDLIKGIPQFVTQLNASGAYYEVEVMPLQ